MNTFELSKTKDKIVLTSQFLEAMQFVFDFLLTVLQSGLCHTSCFSFRLVRRRVGWQHNVVVGMSLHGVWLIRYGVFWKFSNSWRGKKKKSQEVQTLILFNNICRKFKYQRLVIIMAVITCIDITVSWDWGRTAYTGGTRENTNTTYTKVNARWLNHINKKKRSKEI